METIKNYLDTMFANIPDNEETRRAKQELFSMMEDKYNELISSGMPKNEVIGTIITEFGNTDELMEILGVGNKTKGFEEAPAPAATYTPDPSRRLVSINEAYEYIMDSAFCRFLLGLGVFFCIISPMGPVLGSGLGEVWGLKIFSGMFEGLGVSLLFVSVAIGVGLIIFSGAKSKEWEFLEKELCALDPDAEDEVENELRQNQNSKSSMLALGILLCIVSVVPVSLFGIISFSNFLTGALGPALIFLLSGAGVFFILNCTRKTDPCEKLLKLKEKTA